MEEIKRIVLIGPESTGKSTLAEQLAYFYGTIWMPEYAREYVEKLNQPYTFEDVVIIAKRQIEIEKDYLLKAKQYLFIDTDLIITKIWFLEVYKTYPQWIDKEIRKKETHLYLLCNTDIEWQPDPIRENAGEMREYLFERYKQELEKLAVPFGIVSGRNKQRLDNAIQHIQLQLDTSSPKCPVSEH